MFYIGQEVVCIQTHSRRIVIKGVHYFIKGLKKGCCDNNQLDIDVGKTSWIEYSYCTYCCTSEKNHGICWLNSVLFAPIESISESNEIEVKMLIEESQKQLI